MKTPERINGTFVRHHWKAVTKGLAEGKTFVVENHGKREAIVMLPDKQPVPKHDTLDLKNYFARLKKQPAVSLSEINAALARSPE